MNLTRRLLMSGALAAGIVLALLGSMGASASSAVFKNPGAIALDHQGHLWVANSDYFGITEIRASTGKVIRVINAKADGFIDPSGIAVSGNDVWVVNGGVTYRNGTSHVGTVTELNATTCLLYTSRVVVAMVTPSLVSLRRRIRRALAARHCSR